MSPRFWFVLSGAVVFCLLVGATAWDLRQRRRLVEPYANLLTREEFRRTVIGRTTPEVRELLGPPDLIQGLEIPPPRSMWVYRQRTRVPGEAEPDLAVYLVIEDGLVTTVFFDSKPLPRPSTAPASTPVR